MNSSPFFSHFATKYCNGNAGKNREAIVKQYNKDYYDQLANFYLELSEDKSKSFKKYKGFDYMKVLTRKDVYDSLVDKTNKERTDAQVELLNYHQNGLISRKEFLRNFNTPSLFLSQSIPWEEFLYLFSFHKPSNNSNTSNDLSERLKVLHTSIKNKQFDFKEYHSSIKRTKIGIIMGYFVNLKH